MAKVVDMGSPVVTQTQLNVNVPSVTDVTFVTQSDEPGEWRGSAITTELDRPCDVRFAVSRVSNIYNGSGVSTANQAPSKEGLTLLAQVTQIASVTDDSDPSYRIDLPLSAHIVLKVPRSSDLTTVDLEAFVSEAFGLLYDGSSTRLARLLRGGVNVLNQ